MKLQNILILIITFVLVSCKGQTNDKIEVLAASDFFKKITGTSNPQILDVRTPEEFNEDHLENAVNINWNSNDFTSKLNVFNKTKPVFVYCLSGGRSKKATDKLEELGFLKIYELQGGILKWNAAGFGTSSDKIIGMSLEKYTKLIGSSKKVLINFYADWCAPCKKMQPYMLEIQKNKFNEIVVIRLNADENKTLLKEMKIDELPALFLYEDNTIKWKHAGFISEEDLKLKLK